MNRQNRATTTRLLAGAAVAAASVALSATPANAQPAEPAGRMTSEVTCDGAPLTVATAPGNGGNNWGAVQVVDSGPLVLVSLEYAVHDDTANILLADEILSHGRAHLQQADDTMTCVVASESAALRDVLPPGMPLPSGTALHDLVTSTLTAVVVPRP